MTHRIKAFVALAIALGIALSSPATTQAQPYHHRARKFQVGLGGGFIADPGGGSFGFDFSYYFINLIAISPRFSAAFANNKNFFNLMVDARFTFELTDVPSALRPLKPFVGGGIGLVIADFEGVDVKAAFSPEVIFGAEYFVNNEISLGTQMNFFWLVDDVFDESFVFQWHLLTVRYLF